MLTSILPDLYVITVLALFFFIGLSYSRDRSFRLSLFLVFVIALVLRIAICADPFLHIYDERFHALVSSNLRYHLLKPTLYDNPILPYNYSDWWANHIWLSKPSLPMLPIAGSIALFGNHEYAVRLPSIIFGCLTVGLTYKICRLYYSASIAYIASFLHAIHGTTLELIGGRLSSDHVDVSFLFFSELFIYLLLQQSSKPNRSLAGLSLLFAFLCKWVFAFLPMAIGLCIVFAKIEKGIFKNLWITFMIFFGGSGLYLSLIYNNYPEEISSVIQGVIHTPTDTNSPHIQGIGYYVGRIRILFGELIYLPLILLGFEIANKDKRQSPTLVIAIWILVPLILLSTSIVKRAPYILISAPAYLMLTAYYFDRFWNLNYKKPSLNIGIKMIGILLILLPFRYSAERMKLFKPYPVERIKTSIIKDLDISNIDIKKSVILNDEYPIEVMFYTGVTCYSNPPSDSLLSILSTQGYKTYIRDGMQLIKL